MAAKSRNYKKKKRRNFKEEIYLLSPAVSEDCEWLETNEMRLQKGTSSK